MTTFKIETNSDWEKSKKGLVADWHGEAQMPNKPNIIILYFAFENDLKYEQCDKL